MRCAEIGLDLVNNNWFYHDNQEQKFRFRSDDVFKLTECIENATEVNALLLRESEPKHLAHEEREELSKLLGKYDDIFRPGEDPTPHNKTLH